MKSNKKKKEKTMFTHYRSSNISKPEEFNGQHIIPLIEQSTNLVEENEEVTRVTTLKNRVMVCKCEGVLETTKTSKKQKKKTRKEMLKESHIKNAKKDR